MMRRTILALLLSSLSLPLLAATITVTGTGDAIATDGFCTLREAITAANTNTAVNECTAGSGPLDTLLFNIGGGGAQTINVTSSLPPLVEALGIVGQSQPGFTSTPLITVSGVSGADGFVITAPAHGSVLGYLSIVNFATAITIQDSGYNINHNYIGIDATGTTAMPNQIGILITGTTTANSFIDANVISGNTQQGVLVTNSVPGTSKLPNIFLDNIIGLNAAGTAAVPNAVGIELQSEILTQIHDNTIAGNSGAGLVLTNTSNTDIHDNVIGKPGLGNGAQGVLVNSGTGNHIYTNSMAGNGTLCIDLAPIGTTPNDACDGDSGANQLQNFPLLTSAVSSASATVITGTLNSTAVSSFTLEFFRNPAAPAQGKQSIGMAAVTTNGSCVGSFTATLPVALPVGELVTATATDNANNTSEMSAAATVDLPLNVTKNFSPASILRNTTSTLTVTIQNGNAETNVGFTDTLPANVVIAASPAASSSCGGTVTAVAGGGSFSLSGGTIAGGGSCVVSVDVTSGVAGNYTNTLPAGSVTSTLSQNTSAASASLQVTELPAPTITKSFAPASILPGGTTQLTITLTNASSTAITGVQFTDQYPTGLENAAAPSTTCGGTVTAPLGGSTLALSGGTIPASGSCTVSVTVRAPNGGSFTNTLPAGSVTSANSAPSGGAASAALAVAASIPTTSEWGLLLILIALGTIAAMRLRG